MDRRMMGPALAMLTLIVAMVIASLAPAGQVLSAANTRFNHFIQTWRTDE